MRRERRKEKQRLQKIQRKEVKAMAELFWSVFNLEMKDVPEIVAFALEYLFPGLEFILLHGAFLSCLVLLGIYLIDLNCRLWHYFHNRKKPIRVYPPKGKG